MNEIDADGDKPDQHFDGRAAENSTVAEKKQFVTDQWSGNVKEMVAALLLAGPTDVQPRQKHIYLVRITVNCCTDTDEVVNKYCFVHGV